MKTDRMQKIQQVVESCRHKDNSEVEREKTAVIEELLAELVECMRREVGRLGDADN
jgi:hypothetical protein